MTFLERKHLFSIQFVSHFISVYNIILYLYVQAWSLEVNFLFKTWSRVKVASYKSAWKALAYFLPIVRYVRLKWQTLICLNLCTIFYKRYFWCEAQIRCALKVYKSITLIKILYWLFLELFIYLILNQISYVFPVAKNRTREGWNWIRKR